METSIVAPHAAKSRDSKSSHMSQHYSSKPNNQVGSVMLYGIPIVSLIIDSQERLCLAQISNTLLKQFSYNEIHNRRVALGITCVQCTPVQLEILRRAGAMPVSSRRCGMITRREAERLCKSFLGDNAPPRLPDDFAFSVHHECAWGCRGAFLPSRYNSSRAKCIKCSFCGLFFSPNKFIFHSHRTGPGDKYIQPDAANFNSWRRHMKLSGGPPEEIVHAWEDVKAMFNGGTRKRLMGSSSCSSENGRSLSSPKQSKIISESPSPAPSTINFPVTSPSPALTAPTPRVPPFPEISLPLSRSLVMDYVWHQSQAVKQHNQFPFPPYSLPWLKRGSPLFFGHNATDSPLLSFHRNESKPIFHQSAFRPVQGSGVVETGIGLRPPEELSDDETVDIETTEDEELNVGSGTKSPKQGWNSPKTSENDHQIEEIPSSPASVKSNTAVRSSPSPIALKLETDASPPPQITHLLNDENNLTDRRERYGSLSPQEGSIRSPVMYDRNFLKHNEYGERMGIPDRPDIRGYQRENVSPQERLDYPRDSLWSVARLTLERFERPELYRPDISGPIRSFIENNRERNRISPKITDLVKPADCTSCLACHPEPIQSPHLNLQTCITTGENNNKIASP